jgi:hypothetical protein
MHERCLKCDHWNHNLSRCDRVLKGSVRLGMEGGRLTGVMVFETTPGLLNKDLEADLSEFLVESIPALVESWPGWGEVFRLHEGKHCAAEQPKECLDEISVRVLKVVKKDEDPADDTPGYLKTEGWSGF